MSEWLERVRAVAMQLPGAEERASDGQPTFFVGDKQFAQFRDDGGDDGLAAVCVRTDDLDEQAMPLGPDVDWALVEDRIARSWELAAPAGLLEAGGR